jgi:23S rRNA (guanine745-N1)-methyltransferase
MPVESESVDVLVNTFSPLAIEETRRVVKAGGAFVMAIPAEEHLFGLKRAVYKTPYKNTVADTHLDGFRLTLREEIKYPLNLNTRQDIRSLFMMTPYAYRTAPADREKVLLLDNLQTDAHFIILVYRKEK